MPICAIGPQEAHAPLGPIGTGEKTQFRNKSSDQFLIGGILTLKETGSRDRC